MTKCSVLFCKNYSDRAVNISFHPFPVDPSRRREWVKAVRRERSWIPTKHTRICSIHFEEECYNNKSKLQKKLLKDAIPTLNFPEFLHNEFWAHLVGTKLENIANEDRPPTRFPTDPSRRREWVKSVRRERKWIPTKHSMICSIHFEVECYNKKSKTQKKLLKDAIPTLNLPEFETGNRKSCEEDVSEACRSQPEAGTSSQHASGTDFRKSVASEPDPIPSDSPEATSELNKQALKVTLARIEANPQFYIGIPKNCYHIVDILQKQTRIPTTTILLCLKKLKLDTQYEELADQFGTTASEAAGLFVRNLPVIAKSLHSFVTLQVEKPNKPRTPPEDAKKRKKEPTSLPTEHKTVVFETLELNVQPTTIKSRELTQTERGNTVKYLTGCSKDGQIGYISPGYGGRQSNETLLENTNFLARFKPGDSVIANGFRNVEHILLRKGLKLINPLKIGAGGHKVMKNSDQSSECIYPDVSVVQRVREFLMFKDRSEITSNLMRVLDDAVVTACALINLQSFVIN